jgi:hypothetical protein
MEVRDLITTSHSPQNQQLAVETTFKSIDNSDTIQRTPLNRQAKQSEREVDSDLCVVPSNRRKPNAASVLKK